MNRIYQGKVTGVEIYVPANKENPWQPFDPDPKQAKAIGYRSSVIGHSPKAHARQHFQDAMN